MRTFAKLTLVALTALVLGSCQKQTTYDDPVVPGPTGQPVQPAPIMANLQGTVLDETGNPASGVTVKVGTASVTTDAAGYFRINGAALDKNQALVSATKSGYFKAYRSFAATSATNQVVLKLVKRTQAGTVDAAAGGTASLSNGSKVTLPAGGVVDASTGASYTGAVKIFAAYIDPSATDISQSVPGSLMADDKDGRRTVLTSYGMLAVELEGSNGQKLQVKSGSQATVTTAIPTAAQASAPATLPMWYLDEASGVWKEQGTASKSGTAYVGTVSHFTFWNCDVANGNVVTLSLTVNGSNGAPMPYARVRLGRSNGMATYTYTDSSGHASGYVPAAEALTLAILDNCGATVYTQNIGPFTTNTNIPAITVNTSGQTTLLSGRLVDCNNTGVAGGIVRVSVGWQHYTFLSDASGNFSGNIISCNTSVTVTGYDSTLQTQSTTATVPFNAGTMQAGNLTVCSIPANTDFFRMTVDGVPYLFTSADTLYNYNLIGSVVAPTNSVIIGGNNWANGSARICDFYQYYPFGTTIVTGTPYPLYLVTVQLPGYTYYDNSGQFTEWYSVQNNSATVTYTSIASAVGGYTSGTFQGTAVQHNVTSPRTITVSGSFRVKRIQ